MTTHRIEVGLVEGVDDPRGENARLQAQTHLGLAVERVRTHNAYLLDGFGLAEGELDRVRRALTDPVIEHSAVGRLEPPACSWVIAVGYRPGVTDNVGRTAAVFVRDLLGASNASDQPSGGGRVFGEVLYFVAGPELAREDVERLGSGLLANELIERITVWSREEYVGTPPDLSLPLAGVSLPPRAEPVPMPDDDAALETLSRERTLSLSLAELRVIRDHFYGSASRRERRLGAGLPEHPTDVELEALAQTWSEHCKHKIFNARIDYRESEECGGARRTVDSLFKTYIVGSTKKIAERVDWLVSVFDDNAGVVRVADDLNVVYKVETHNSPSALDPVGGAMTGIVGVNRDPFGTGIGAALLTNVWGYCLGPPDFAEELPKGLLHPRRIRDGVHRGVIEGGNQSGIPYSRGWEIFDHRYVGKPLVFCGTVGVMPAQINGQPSERKQIEDGDVVVMVGGRIGKDGIHGATFSSEALHGGSPVQAVQIGDPITQKMMTDMLLEARDAGLYRAITDNGAGGLSSSVGEMAELVGGAELHLERAPLKYEGLMPWEILVSEAQERMTLAVPPDKLEALLELAARREVEATAIGTFNTSGRFEVFHAGTKVADLEMAFLHGGCPQMSLRASWSGPPTASSGHGWPDVTCKQLLIDTLEDFNHCSKESWARQYDHEVKGLSVIKPLVGVRRDVPADATVMRISHESDQAIILAEGIAPRLSEVDGRAMGAYVVDLAVRRTVAGGGRLGAIAGLDNFCWPDPVQSAHTPDGERKLATLVRCCEAVAELTEALDVPLISGKDSMKNDAMLGGVKISIPPTLLLSTIGWIDDARRALDLTIPGPGHTLYLLGATDNGLGGSHFYTLLARRMGRQIHDKAPLVDPVASRALCELVMAAHDHALLAAAHAPDAGGLALALAHLCLASGLGLEIDLNQVPTPQHGGWSPELLLFAESASRMLVAIPEDRTADFEHLASASTVPWGRLGTVGGPSLRVTAGDGPGPLVPTASGQVVIDVSLTELRRAYCSQEGQR